MNKFLLFLVLAGLAYLIGSPYIVLSQLRAAVESRSGEEIAEHVDFVTLRQNLKDQLNARMSAAVGADDEGLGAALGAMLGGFIADRAIDAYVTRAGLASIMNGAKPTATGPQPSDDTGTRDTEQVLQNATLRYASWDRFSATIAHEDGSSTALILRRRGLSWQLTNVLLPE